MTDPRAPDDDPRWRAPRPRRGGLLCGTGAPSCGTLDGRAPCAACGATTCAACASPCRGCERLARIRAVCAGGGDGAPGTSRAGAAKLFAIVRTLGPARDVLVAPEHVVVRVLGDPRYHEYFAHDGPLALAWIFRDAGVTQLARSLVARAASGPTGLPIHRGSAEEIAWLIPLARGVEVRFRPPPPEGAPRAPVDVPETGAWALPAPWSEPPRAAPVPAFVDGAGVACPHCSAPSPRYRALVGAFVCPACGRSFASEVLGARPRATP